MNHGLFSFRDGLHQFTNDASLELRQGKNVFTPDIAILDLLLHSCFQNVEDGCQLWSGGIFSHIFILYVYSRWTVEAKKPKKLFNNLREFLDYFLKTTQTHTGTERGSEPNPMAPPPPWRAHTHTQRESEKDPFTLFTKHKFDWCLEEKCLSLSSLIITFCWQ